MILFSETGGGTVVGLRVGQDSCLQGSFPGKLRSSFNHKQLSP